MERGVLVRKHETKRQRMVLIKHTFQFLPLASCQAAFICEELYGRGWRWFLVTHPSLVPQCNAFFFFWSYLYFCCCLILHLIFGDTPLTSWWHPQAPPWQPPILKCFSGNGASCDICNRIPGFVMVIWHLVDQTSKSLFVWDSFATKPCTTSIITAVEIWYGPMFHFFFCSPIPKYTCLTSVRYWSVESND